MSTSWGKVFFKSIILQNRNWLASLHTNLLQILWSVYNYLFRINILEFFPYYWWLFASAAWQLSNIGNKGEWWMEFLKIQYSPHSMKLLQLKCLIIVPNRALFKLCIDLVSSIKFKRIYFMYYLQTHLYLLISCLLSENSSIPHLHISSCTIWTQLQAASSQSCCHTEWQIWGYTIHKWVHVVHGWMWYMPIPVFRVRLCHEQLYNAWENEWLWKFTLNFFLQSFDI